jgi:hypothetical protein
MNREVLVHKQKLDNLIREIDEFHGDDELLAHLAKYLCIMVCGFLEDSLRTIYGDYAEKKASPNVANYVDSQLNGFQNPNMEKILTLAGSFCPAWREDLEKVTKEFIKESVDGLVGNRNQIAHGVSVGITIGNMKRQYENVVKLIGFVEKQCAGRSLIGES